MYFCRRLVTYTQMGIAMYFNLNNPFIIMSSNHWRKCVLDLRGSDYSAQISSVK